MKFLSFLVLLLLVSSSYGQENPQVGEVLQNVENLVGVGSEKVPESKSSKLVVGTERIRFFDGSDLKGTLLELDQENNLFWRHESSYEPIRFKFRAIESVVLDRFSKTDVDRSASTFSAYT